MPVEPPSQQATPPRIAASFDQIVAAIDGLTKPELARLRSFARERIKLLGDKRRGRDHEDLIQEAITATLRGDRHWYRDVDFRHYLYWAMYSISNRWITAAKEVVAKNDSDLTTATADDEVWSPVAETPSQSSTPEHLALVREQLEVIDRLLQDDPTALRVYGFLRQGFKGPDIQEATGLTLSAYETIMKRLRWKVRRMNQS